MSDIKAGDLVVVIKPTLCCGADRDIGSIYRVRGISDTGAVCQVCNAYTSEILAMETDKLGSVMSRLKKIPPLTEPETIERNKEITA